jgi:hypothetical protein
MAIATLRKLGVAVYDIDATQPPGQVFEQVKEELGLDLRNLPYDRDKLSKLKEVADALGVEAWASSGAVYRRAWNNVFGPVQESTDIDIQCATLEDAEKLQYALMKRYPDIRWAAFGSVPHRQTAYGMQAANLEEAITQTPLTFRQSAVRLGDDGQIEVLATKAAERSLRSGQLAVDEEFMRRLPADQAQEMYYSLVKGIRKTLREYPGLQLADGELKQQYEKEYGEHHPRAVVASYNRLQEQVVEAEREKSAGRSPRPWNMNDAEKAVGLEVRDFYLRANKTPSAPPTPAAAKLPEPLETMRTIKMQGKFGYIVPEDMKPFIEGANIPPPDGTTSWLQHLSRDADDATFREWLLDQTRSPKPFGGQDPDITKLMQPTYTEMQELANAFLPNTLELKGLQKVTHQGWELRMHLVQSTLQVSTDGITNQLKTQGKSEEFCQDVRSAMRLSLLYHDLGKIVDISTPGVHEAFGKRLWERMMKPEWVNDRTNDLVKWILDTHNSLRSHGAGADREGRRCAGQSKLCTRSCAFLQRSIVTRTGAQ